MAMTRDTAIHNYVTDMLSLEEHIEKALKAQAAEFQADYPDVGRVLLEMHQTILTHIGRLRAVSQGGKGVGDVMKRAASMMAGLGAAAIDLVRNEKLPKDLRDDYTAFSLAAVGYSMLHTTALALHADEVAELAYNHLRDYAAMVVGLNQIIPQTVLQLLHSDGLSPDFEVLQQAQRNVMEVWRGNS